MLLALFMNPGAKLKNYFIFGSDVMKRIERPEYMQRLLDLMGTTDIKIITGIRRCNWSSMGKTTGNSYGNLLW